MSNTIQVNRGTFASLPTLAAGELGFSTDTHQVFVGDGVNNHELQVKDTPLTLGENGIKLDSLLSANAKYSGRTCDGVLGATIAVGDLLYLNSSDQRWELTDADVEATSGDVQLALALASGVNGDTRLLLLDGFVRFDIWNFTSYGKALFISLTPGEMIQDNSSFTTDDIVRVVGYASTFADQIYFKPGTAWVKHP